MSIDCQPSAGGALAAKDASPPSGNRRLDRIDEPARPLGAKRAALQLRRLRNSVARDAAKPQASGLETLHLMSKDGSVGIVMRASLNSLLVERTQHQAQGARLVQCMAFGDQGTFDRWCESEPMRFEDAVLYDQLRREGHGAFGSKR